MLFDLVRMLATLYDKLEAKISRFDPDPGRPRLRLVLMALTVVAAVVVYSIIDEPSLGLLVVGLMFLTLILGGLWGALRLRSRREKRANR
jgi:hypothetical protein